MLSVRRGVMLRLMKAREKEARNGKTQRVLTGHPTTGPHSSEIPVRQLWHAYLQVGNAGRTEHRFGEGAHAHHVQHIKFGGSDTVENCVVICQSCHYSAHEGGNYHSGTVVGREGDFPHFRG